MSTGIPSKTAQVQKSANMSSSTNTDLSANDLGIESRVQTASGVQLSSQQKVLVGSVLDVFLPSLKNNHHI
jgi:hypothetical protein